MLDSKKDTDLSHFLLQEPFHQEISAPMRRCIEGKP